MARLKNCSASDDRLDWKETNESYVSLGQSELSTTYNTYIASQHRSVGDVSADVVGLSLEGRAVEAFRLSPPVQSYENVTQPVVDSLEEEEGGKVSRGSGWGRMRLSAAGN